VNGTATKLCSVRLTAQPFSWVLMGVICTPSGAADESVLLDCIINKVQSGQKKIADMKMSLFLPKLKNGRLCVKKPGFLA
jgi:hypothetical protein